MDKIQSVAELLHKHGSMGYGGESPIRCNCRKIIGRGRDDLNRRDELLAAHQAEVLAAEGLLA